MKLYYAQILEGKFTSGTVDAKKVGKNEYSFGISVAPSPQVSQMRVVIPGVAVDISGSFVIGKNKEAVIRRFIDNLNELIANYEKRIEVVKTNIAEAYKELIAT